MSDLEEQKPGVSRRTVAKAMAWSVPVVALAVPTPAYAASPGIITLTGTGCKMPGNSSPIYKGYAFRATISNTTNAAISVDILTVILDGNNLGDVTVVQLSPCTNLGDPFIVPANSNFEVAIVTADAGNSQNGSLTVSYTVDGSPDQATAVADGLPPMQEGGGGSCEAFSDAEVTCILTTAV